MCPTTQAWVSARMDEVDPPRELHQYQQGSEMTDYLVTADAVEGSAQGRRKRNWEREYRHGMRTEKRVGDGFLRQRPDCERDEQGEQEEREEHRERKE